MLEISDHEPEELFLDLLLHLDSILIAPFFASAARFVAVLTPFRGSALF
jgi:hypothetical protein